MGPPTTHKTFSVVVISRFGSGVSSGIKSVLRHCPAMPPQCQWCGGIGHVALECPALCWQFNRAPAGHWVPAGHCPNGCGKPKHRWRKGKGKSKLDSPHAGGGEPDKGRTKGKGMPGKGMHGKGKHWWPKGKGKSKLGSPYAGGGEPGRGRTEGNGMHGKGKPGNAQAVESTAVADRHEIIKKRQ